MTLPASKLVKSQVITKTKAIKYDGKAAKINVFIRHDDKCGNGHNSFSITGEIYAAGDRAGDPSMCGCIHEEIGKRFPELKPLIKWHLTSTDGPMHYVANTVYFAGDVDHNGNTPTSKKQIRNGKTGKLVCRLKEKGTVPCLVDSDDDSNGKERELEKARSAAVWPDATDEELTSPGLKERLEARLPALMVEFKEAVESLGLVY